MDALVAAQVFHEPYETLRVIGLFEDFNHEGELGRRGVLVLEVGFDEESFPIGVLRHVLLDVLQDLGEVGVGDQTEENLGNAGGVVLQGLIFKGLLK